ncbi:hypothetical protein K2173_027845 [Erythroxylum novogranatense]|uniref:BHLH domain-containing protein n=1 Tax=Erythroxylum novogranatense TaxID=1862640 RepID=A0AAV8U439_9ROSI|nr:hypothetical protein K2173_027845 [Erythroxylum novogranatense]
MESANLHQLQDQLVGSSSSSSSSSSASLTTAPSTYRAANSQGWTQSITLNADNFSPNYNGVILNPRHRNENLIPPVNNSMIQDSSFHWINNGGSFSNHYLQLPKLQGELSVFPKFTDMLVESPSSTVEDPHLSTASYVKNEQKDLSDLSEKLLLKTISSGFPINGHQNSSIYGSSGRGQFSQIHPSINISSLNQSSSSISGSFDMNLQASDLLISSTRSSGSFGQPSSGDILGMYKDTFGFSVDQMPQSSQISTYNPSKMISSFNNTDQTKRPNTNLMESTKATQAAPPKKSRLDSRATFPPFKVRKEKLGDRIAALQQLVAPFGKTDTASVLMEAIGYIKFLQNQVETLSVPYMKSSRNKISRARQGGENGNEEMKRDLRSRGLCLVPLSCMSYVTSDVGGGGGMWPPPNFGGGTYE